MGFVCVCSAGPHRSKGRHPSSVSSTQHNQITICWLHWFPALPCISFNGVSFMLSIAMYQFAKFINFEYCYVPICWRHWHRALLCITLLISFTLSIAMYQLSTFIFSDSCPCMWKSTMSWKRKSEDWKFLATNWLALQWIEASDN